MNIEIEERGQAAVIRLTGDLRSQDGGDFVSQVASLLNRDQARVVLDLGGVGLVSSAGLGDLVRLTAQANSQGGRMVLANLKPFVAGVLETTRLDRFFETFPTVEAALAALGQK